MVGPNLPFGGLACGLVLGPLPSPCMLWAKRASITDRLLAPLDHSHAWYRKAHNLSDL